MIPEHKVHWQCNVYKFIGWTDELFLQRHFSVLYLFNGYDYDCAMLSDYGKSHSKEVGESDSFLRGWDIIILIEKRWVTVIKRIDDRSE